VKATSKARKSLPKRGRTGGATAAVTPRIARRERRREHSRAEILEATRRVLLREGIAATTLDAVAKEVGVSKTAIYYYFASKEALLFEVVFAAHEAHATAVHDAVEQAEDGGEALAAIVRETVRSFAPRLDDFRLAFLQAQVAGPSAVHIKAEQLARIRPLNDLAYAGAARILTEERKKRQGRARVEPRMMAFLANAAAIGLLTMKGLVESFDDPLLYSDEQLVDGLARIFAAAAAP
jgi:AcrR family transcriptional regulator